MPDLMDRPLGPAGEVAPAWPAKVRTELARRRERLVSGLDGPVLDLGEPAGLARVVSAGSEGGGDLAGRYDAVVSVAALVAVPDLPVALRGIAQVLAPGGRFLFVEPVARPGWTGMLAASTGALLRPVRGQHVGRDVPAALRAAGFMITDLERFAMPTSLWPLRSFIDGCARARTGLEP